MYISTHKVIPKHLCSKDYLDKFVYANPFGKGGLEFGFSEYDEPEDIVLYDEAGDFILLPRNIKINPPGVKESDFTDRRVLGKGVQFTSKINPFESQVPAIEEMVNTDDGILVAPCGSGKTIMALEAIARVGRTTLVLVHKEFLMYQWADRIKEFLGEDAGIVQGDRWEWKGKKIVIGMLQTLYSQRDKISEEFINWPGVVTSDEVHRLSAPTWSKVIGLFPSKRRWGLTASPKRGDGLEFVFHAHMGDVAYTVQGNDLSPLVVFVQTGCHLPTKRYCIRGKIRLPMLITGLTLIEERNRKIITLLIQAAKAGRKILLLTDRVNHVKYLKENFDYNTEGLGITTSLYIGETTQEERKIAERADVIFATSQMAKEGLDIPELDTLFFTSVTSSRVTTQQAAGRILRPYPGKKPPLVIDFVDQNELCVNFAKKRMQIYTGLNYPIKVV